MSLLTHWKDWFASWDKVGHTISMEEMYQAFKDRLMDEPIPSRGATEPHETSAAPPPETPHASNS